MESRRSAHRKRWTTRVSNGARTLGSHIRQHGFIPPSSRLSQGGSLVAQLWFLPITSPHPLSFSLHALLNQFRIPFDPQVRSLLCTCTVSLHIVFSLLPTPFPSLLATTASIETSATVIFLPLVYCTAQPGQQPKIWHRLARLPATLFSFGARLMIGVCALSITMCSDDLRMNGYP